MADLLCARARTLVQLYRDEKDRTRVAAQKLATFLQLQAANQEDIAAANGMRAYYSRIAVTEQLILSDQALAFVNAEEVKQQALIGGGLAAGTDLSAFERRRIDILDQRLQLESKDSQLANLLKQLSHLDYACGDVIQETLEVHPHMLDCIELQQLALLQRHDLCGWKLLANSVDSKSAPEFAKMLPTLIGGWALPVPKLGSVKALLCSSDLNGLAANMKRELDLVVRLQTELICQSVADRCRQLELAYRRMDLAKRVVESWLERIEQLEQLELTGRAKPEENAVAHTELLQARAEEISRRLEARLAEVDLAEAVGGLANRCCEGAAWLLTGSE